jgi:hypothetical protein
VPARRRWPVEAAQKAAIKHMAEMRAAYAFFLGEDDDIELLSPIY